MAKVILPNGVDVTENGLPDVNLFTPYPLYPLDTSYFAEDGRVYHYRHEVKPLLSLKEV